MIGVWTPLPQWKMGLITEQDDHEARTGLIRQSQRLLLTGGLLSLVFMILGYALLKVVQAHEADQRVIWLFANLNQGAFVLDDTGRFTNVNESLCKQFGTKRKNLIGATLNDIDPQLEQLLSDLRQRAATDAGGSPTLDRIIEKTNDGVKTYLRVRLTVILQQGRLQFGGLSVDITEAQQTKKELEKAKHIAEMTSQTRTDLLSMIGHELRTPLNAIIGPLSIIGISEDIEQARSMIGVAEEQASLLLERVENLERFIKINSGDAGKFDEVVGINALVAAAVENAGTRANATIRPRVHLGKEAPQTIVSDGKILEWIVQELVLNAYVHGAPENDPNKLELIIRSEASNRDDVCHIDIIVEDNGNGLPDHIAENLKEPFLRGESDNTTTARGLGIGLSIAHRYTELLKGQLNYSQTDDGGSRFTISLPV